MDVNIPTTPNLRNEMEAAINKLPALLDRLKGPLKHNRLKQALLVADEAPFMLRKPLTEEESIRMGELTTRAANRSV